MPLARLENFLKNLNGNTLYVDPNELDATDSIENRGNSRLRPFKTIQRALLEAARFSYVAGSDNDLFDQTTILISPGTHYIDNRPGYYVDASNNIFNVNNSPVSIPEFNILSNFDINDSDNELYTYNSVDGGVIIPKGTSLVASDLRKTKIRPLFVPDPNNSLIEKTSIFRLTGSCYFFGFSICDGDPLGKVYNTYAANTITPSYSHHKLTAFEYADGVNKVGSTGRTDLEMYYYKVAKGFGQQSGRSIIDGYLNLQPNVDEYRIVGELGVGFVNISSPTGSVKSGDGITGTNVITVTTDSPHGLFPLTPILVSGVGIDEGAPTTTEYNGNFIVSQVLSPTQFTYLLTQVPTASLQPSTNGATVKVLSDTVSSSSPYVFNCSLKSVYGMNGLHADGSKATGFRSMVTAQFTGISLQKDDDAFVKYNENTGTYIDQTSVSESEFLHQSIDSIYDPEWQSFHIKASNDAFIQCVSIFAIGYANQFVASEGGDQSITNSNSNFGQQALFSEGFKSTAYPKDDHGFITHVIPPKDVAIEEQNIDTFVANSSLPNSTSKIYLEGYDDILNIPNSKFRNYSVGGKQNDKIYYTVNNTEYNAEIIPNYKIEKQILSVDDSNNRLELNNLTGISTGIPVKIISKNSILPDGIEHDRTYFARVESGNYINLYENLTNCISGTSQLDIKSTVGFSAGNLYLVSRISELSSGDVGSPIQWDDTEKNWYLGVNASPTFVSNLLGNPPLYLKRVLDTRSKDDKIYRIRYVVPKESSSAAVPTSGFIFQKSASTLDSTYPTVSTNTLQSLSSSRNKNVIIDAYYSSGTATIVTKNPHNLKVGNKVKIYNLKSSNEPSPVGLGTGTGYNGTFVVSSVANDLTFSYSTYNSQIGSTIDPGTITAGVSTVTSWYSNVTSSFKAPPYTIYETNRESLPHFTCNQTNNYHQAYSIKQIQKYVQGSTDGIYHITLDSFKNTPLSSPFNTSNYKFGQDLDYIYPKIDYDNLIVDPDNSTTAASRKTIGLSEINDPYLSSTKESLIQYLKDLDFGKEITNFTKSGNNVTITTAENHGIGGIRRVTANTTGSGYINGWHFDIPLTGGTGSNATINVRVVGNVPTTYQIANPGSGYTINDVLTVRGIPGSTSTTTVTASLLNFSSTDSDLIQIFGASNSGNNGAFIISSVGSNTITFTNPSGVNESSTSAVVVNSGLGYVISSDAYNSTTAITTITTPFPHPFSIGNKVIFDDSSLGICTITSVSNNTTFTVSGNTTSATKVYSVGLVPTLKDTNTFNENLNTRNFAVYDGYKSKLQTAATNSTTVINVTDIDGLNKGDFVQIDSEIMLVTRISGGNATVIRGLFGTQSDQHAINSSVKTINILPVELRRPSILRASGHTFEYVGFGPGNYSTSMPSNQTKILSDDEVSISQALSNRGGTIFYSGMNSNGELFIGKRKWNASTGDQITVVGQGGGDGEASSFDEITVNKITVNQEINASTATQKVKELTVSGSSTFNSNVTINADLSVSGTISGDLEYSVSAGNGLNSSSFNNSQNVTFSLGTPSGITSTSTNSVSGTTHSHELVNGSVTAPKLSGGQTGNPPVYGVRAWVNFRADDGNGVPINNPVIRSSGNIGTVTKISNGKYSIAFSTPMPNTNYAVVCNSSSYNNTDSVADGYGYLRETDNAYTVRVISTTVTVNGFTIVCTTSDASDDRVYDPNIVSIMVIG